MIMRVLALQVSIPRMLSFLKAFLAIDMLLYSTLDLNHNLMLITEIGLAGVTILYCMPTAD